LSCSVGLSDWRLLRRPASGYSMDLHDNQPGAHLRAGVPPDLSHMSTPAFGSLGTAAASRVRATASPGVPVVLMSTPAASMQHPEEGGAALLRPPDSHTDWVGPLRRAPGSRRSPTLAAPCGPSWTRSTSTTGFYTVDCVGKRSLTNRSRYRDS
jgi:hypothetical protein